MANLPCFQHQVHHHQQHRLMRSSQQHAVARETLEAPRRYKTLPYVTYSNLRKDVCVAGLRQLYHTVNQHQTLACGSQVQHSFFQHWLQLSEGQADQKLQLLLDSSVAVVAAFTRDTHLQLPAATGDDGRQAASAASSSSSLSVWGGFPWRQRLPRRLVGFVRAAGDHALVATVHDLIIHPELQGYGLGSMLLKRLVGQIEQEGVYDVGLVSPGNLQPFFHSCSFDLDREDSVPMALGKSWAKEVADINAPLKANARLQRLLDNRLDAAEGSRSLQQQAHACEA